MLGRLPQIAEPAAQATTHAVRRVGRQGTPNERAALARALRAGVSSGLIQADAAKRALASGDVDAVAVLAAGAAQRAGSQFRSLPVLEGDSGLGQHRRMQMLAQGQCERGSAVRWLREAARLGLVGAGTIRAALRRGDARLAWLAQASAQRLARLMTHDTRRIAPASTDAPGAVVSLEHDGWVVHSMLPLHVVELSGLTDCPDHLARAVRTAVDALSIHGLPFRSFMEWEHTMDEDILCWDAAGAMDELEAEKGRRLERADFEVVAGWIGIDPDCLSDLYRIRTEGYGLPEPLIDPGKPVDEVTPVLRDAAAAHPQSPWSPWLLRMTHALEWFVQIDLPEIDSCNGEDVDLLGRCVAPGLWSDIESMQLESFNEQLMQTGDAGLIVSPSLEALRNLLTAIAWVVGLLDEAAFIATPNNARTRRYTVSTPSVSLPDAASLFTEFRDRPLVGFVLHELTAPHAVYTGHIGAERERRTVVTVHPLSESEEGGLHFEPGRPMTPSDHLQVLEALQEGGRTAIPAGYIPERVVFLSASGVTWYAPSVRRTMHFNMGGEREALTVHWPALVFHVCDSRIWLAALAGDERPTPDTPVYHAPLHNVSANGAVCLGGARAPSAGALDNREAWEATIYDTAFSHVNTDRVLTGGGDTETLREFWRARAEEGARPRMQDMAPMGRTLGEWRNAIMEGQR